MTQTDHRPRRSALYMPASNLRAIEKARSLPCDVVILDLEDSVAPDAKEAARDNAFAAVKSGGFGGRELVVRINGLDTPWGSADLAAVAQAVPDAVLVPKISAPEDVLACDGSLSGRTGLWIMVETCRAILEIGAITATAARSRLAALVIGPNDLAKEMRCRLDGQRTALLPALALAVTAARAHGLTVLDGVFNDIDDESGFVAQCRQGADLGFDGKTLIHPRQIDAANLSFSPDPVDLAWARTVVTAFQNPEAHGKGVLRVEGRMVERLHLAEAERLLAVADAIERLQHT